MTLCNKYEDVFAVIRHALWNMPIQNIEKIDFNMVYEVLFDHALISLTAKAMSYFPLDFQLQKKWKLAVLQNIANNANVQWTEKKIIDLIDKFDINAVIIKGSAAACYYPYPELRTRGDIDILVCPDDIDRLVHVLESNSFRYDSRYNYYKHINFIHSNTMVEVHRYFFDGDFPSDTINPFPINPLNDILYKSIGKKIKVDCGGYNTIILPRAENGVVLLQHIKQHLKKGIGLRQILDWMLFVKSNEKDDEFWDEEFIPLLEKLNLTLLAKVITKMCILFLGLKNDYSWCREIDNKQCEVLMDCIMQQGNFGRTAINNKSEYYVQNVVRYSSNSSFFVKLSEIGRNNYSILNNCILGKMAWIFGAALILKKYGHNVLHISQYRAIRERKKLFQLLDL